MRHTIDYQGCQPVKLNYCFFAGHCMVGKIFSFGGIPCKMEELQFTRLWRLTPTIRTIRGVKILN